MSAVPQTSPVRSQMWGLPLQSGRKLRSIVISISGFGGRHIDFGSQRRRTVSTVSYPSLGMVGNMGVEVGIAVPSLNVQKIFPLPA